MEGKLTSDGGPKVEGGFGSSYRLQQQGSPIVICRGTILHREVGLGGASGGLHQAGLYVENSYRQVCLQQGQALAQKGVTAPHILPSLDFYNCPKCRLVKVDGPPRSL
jgi:hypothetical protein